MNRNCARDFMQCNTWSKSGVAFWHGRIGTWQNATPRYPSVILRTKLSWILICGASIFHTSLNEPELRPPIIFIGIILSSFSAALSCLIGASRVLYAMSRDGMFGPMLRLTKKTNKDGNPYVAVLVTWFLVQIILLIGQVNKIAPIVTIFFLMAYAACDLACLGLDWASAPNFRPTFKYFSWQTALAGLISCIAVMFMVNPIWAIVSVAIAIILSAVSHYTAPRVAWGSLSQALIFHQVRKYALKINIRLGYKSDW